MKRIFLLVPFALLALTLFGQTTVKKTVPKTTQGAAGAAAYDITFTLTPYKNTKVYLGTYFGKNFSLADSAQVDAQSSGHFKGKNKLTPGLYFFVSQSRTKLFDFLVDESQHFTIIGDSASGVAKSVTGSPENTLFLDYNNYLSQIGPHMTELQAQLKNPNLARDKEQAIRKELEDYNKQLNGYRLNIVKTHPNSIMAAIFNLMKWPDMPTKLPEVNGKPDSSYIGR
ncbi:MAG TPA: DUF4369 domain-containing protein, partial [Chitinophagaceae bacterium]|nr:DUF4369 domain-containing protein [Chitinophagaceae bacterium]